MPAVEHLRAPGGDLPRAQRKLKDRAHLIERAQNRLATAIADRPARLARFRYLPLAALTADRGTLRRLRSLPNVLSVTEDRPHLPILDSSTPRIGAPAAWAAGYTAFGQAVAVIGTGVDTTHSFFTDQVLSAAEVCFSGTRLNVGGSGVAA